MREKKKLTEIMTIISCRNIFYKSGKSGKDYVQQFTARIRITEEAEKDLRELISIIK